MWVHIIKKEKYRKSKQVSLRQSTYFLFEHLDLVVSQIENLNGKQERKFLYDVEGII